MKLFDADFVFPYYCKLVNEKSFYFLENVEVVKEVQILGKKAFYFERKIAIFPDKMWMKDVFELKELYIEIDKALWEEKLNLVASI